MRLKLAVLAFLYSAVLSMVVFFLLAKGFGEAWRTLLVGDRPFSLLLVFVLVFVSAGLAAAALDLFLIKPLRMLDHVHPDATLGETISKFFDRHARLETQFGKLAAEVNTLASERHALSERIANLAARENWASATLDAVAALTQEMLILTRTDGSIQQLTPATLELIGGERAAVVGRPFEEVVRLYDLEELNPLEHPLTGVVHNAIAQRTTTPGLEAALLVDAKERQHRVFVSAAAVPGHGGGVVAGIVRLQRMESAGAQAAPEEPAAASGGTASASDLPGPELLANRLEVLIQRARGQKAHHVLLFLSVDGLEAVQNGYGHAAGDALLWDVSQIMRAQVPDKGECFRVSSTHFAALMRNAGLEVGTAIAENVRVAVDGREFKWNDLRYDATVSIGVVPVTGESESGPGVIEQADQALMAAKAGGGNRFYVHVPDKAAGKARRNDKEWVDWMSRHLAEGRVHLISQEIQPLGTDERPMLEMLVRVEDDDGAWVAPGAFLPSLVRHDLTAKMDLQLIKRVLMALEHKAATIERYSTLFVNVSGSSIMRPRFLELVETLLSGAEAACSRIGFEVDVLVAINHPAEYAKFVQALRPRGVRFSLDRCKAALGLNALNALPIDFVKIHPALIEKATFDALDGAYVEWINRATHLLKRKTIAVGVQSEATLSFVRNAGVDFVQGHHVNKLGPLIV